MLGRPKPKDKYHIYKLYGLQQSRSIEDHCETMEEFHEQGIWGDVNDAKAKQIGLLEDGWNGVAVCRSMGFVEGNSNNSTRSVKIPWKESCHEENNRRRMRYQSSAPVNIHDWSQLVWKEKKSDNYWRRSYGIVDYKSDDEDDGNRDFERIPPHELIARQLAQREIYSFSVYEGVGRTLKGRDLSQVRNAVWTKTGFMK